MVQLFRLRHSSLRLKKSLFGLLGLFVILFGVGISTGITSGAPLFSTPVVAAQNRYLTDVDMQTRKDGLTFLVGSGFDLNGANAKIRDWLGLTVLNNGNAGDSVNADNLAEDVPQKYPSLAFSPVDGTGYIVWRTKHNSGFVSDLRVIPPAYNGTTNKTLGPQFTLKDKLGYVLDQPAVVVNSAGNPMIVGYRFIQNAPVALTLVTLDRNTFNVIDTKILDTQGAGQRGEMDPMMCIDPNNNIHVVSDFPYGTSVDAPLRQYAYDLVNSGSVVKTDITPPGWTFLRGSKARDIACTADGTVYVAVNNLGQFDLYKRTPGAGGSEKWAKTASNVFQIYADSVAVTVDNTGKIWAAQADGQDNGSGANAHNGANVKFSTDGGFTFSANELAIPNGAGDNKYVAINANPVDNKVHLAISYLFDYADQHAQYAYAISATPPAPPTNLTATNPSTTSINLNWTASPSSPDSYKIYRSTAPGGPFTLIAQIAPATSYQNTNLTPATTYYYEISAVKANLESTFSNIANATTLLGAPGSLSAVAVSSSQINLTWAAPFPAPTSYTVYRSDTLNGTYLPIAQNVAGTSYSNINLLYNTTYYYKVTAVKPPLAESAFSNVATATTLSASSVAFTTQPSSGVAGATLGSQPVVKVVDFNGNTVTNFPGSVTLSLAPGTGNPSASLSATNLTVATSNGVASFSGVTIDAIGAAYQLRATADGGAYGDSVPFNQTGTMAVSDVSGTLQATVPYNISVTIKKNGGATDTKFNSTVYLTLNNPGSAYFYGRTAAIAVNGVATFNYLMIDTAGSNYSYTASIGNNALVPTDTDTPFTLTGYTVPGGACSRFLLTNGVGFALDNKCSRTTLAQSITDSTAPNPNVPVYVDHRASGFGTAQVPNSEATTLPDGVIIDGGCSGASVQGLSLTVSNNLTITGNNHYLRGIYFHGNEASNPLFKGGMGNIMSCDKVEIVTAG